MPVRLLQKIKETRHDSGPVCARLNRPQLGPPGPSISAAWQRPLPVRERAIVIAVPEKQPAGVLAERRIWSQRYGVPVEIKVIGRAVPVGDPKRIGTMEIPD